MTINQSSGKTLCFSFFLFQTGGRGWEGGEREDTLSRRIQFFDRCNSYKFIYSAQDTYSVKRLIPPDSIFILANKLRLKMLVWQYKDCTTHVRCTADDGSITADIASLEYNKMHWKAHTLLNPTFPGMTRRWFKRNQQDLHRSTARIQRFLPLMFYNRCPSCGGRGKTGTKTKSTSCNRKRNVLPVLTTNRAKYQITK